MLITFEGIDGSGKSTVIEHINKYLTAKLYNVIVTREPYSETIRDIIKSEKLHNLTECALFLADRAEHVHRIITPYNNSHIILCDRYIDSTIAYQYGGNGININELHRLNNIFSMGITPTRTYYLDVYPSVAKSRVASRKNEEYDKYDVQSYEFFQRVQAGYEFQYKNFSNRICKIDANQPIEKVIRDIINDLDRVIKIHYHNN